jgi:hypothetical protein
MLQTVLHILIRSYIFLKETQLLKLTVVIMPVLVVILVMLTSEQSLLILQFAEDCVLDRSQWNGSL